MAGAGSGSGIILYMVRINYYLVYDEIVWKKEKIPIPVSTVVLMIVTITYKLVLVVIGIGILIFGQGFLHRYLEGILPVYYLGLGLNVFCVVFMTVLVFHPVLTKEILKKGVHLLEKLRLMKHKEERLEKLDASMDTYRGTAVYLKEHMGVIVVVFGITFVATLTLITIWHTRCTITPMTIMLPNTFDDSLTITYI